MLKFNKQNYLGKRVFLSIKLFCVIYVFCGIIFSGNLTGQNVGYVIAPNGLNVRSEPSLHGKIIDKLTFGDSIEIINKKINLVDTLYQVKNSSDYYICINDIEYFGDGDLYIIGSWIKISVNNNIGYVVDNYIFERRPKIKDSHIVYIDKYNSTWELYFDPNDYNWYSLMKENNKIVLVKSYPDFIKICSEYSGQLITPIYDNLDTSIGLIGSKIGLKDKIVEDVLVDVSFSHKTSDDVKFIKLAGPELTYGNHLKDSFWIYQYIDDSNGINEIFKLTGGASQPIKVRFIGDIDNDGINDYIIWCRTIYDLFEMSLYLSTNRLEGVYIKSSGSYLDFD